MSTQDRLEALRQRHADIDLRIDQEVHRPHPDEIQLQELKRQKLKLKDEIASLQR